MDFFLLFSTFGLHHKWNETRLLSPESKCMGCLKSCQVTTAFSPMGGPLCPHKKKKKDLGYQQVREFQENPRNTWTWWRVSSRSPKNCKKSAVKHAIEKSNLLNFVKFSPSFCQGLQMKNYFLSFSDCF